MAIVTVSSFDSESSDSDYDSGMESDEFDLFDIGDSNFELCQVGNSSFSVPVEIFDLVDLSGVLNLDSWNEILNEKERLELSKFLPDLDYETFSKTLFELFSGKNFHFCSPVDELFRKMKGGLLDPRVVLYERGMSVFKKREYYHSIRKYQNRMVRGFAKVSDAWDNYSCCGIEEKLRVLKTQRSLGYEKSGSDTDMENLRHVTKRIRYDDDDEEEYDEKVNSKVSLMKVGKQKEGFGLHNYNTKNRVINQGVTIAAHNPHSLETMSNAKYPSKAAWSLKNKKMNDSLKFKGKYAHNGGSGAMFNYIDDTESDTEEEDGMMNPYLNNLYDSRKSAKYAKLDKKMEPKGKYKSKLSDPNSMEDIVLVKKAPVSNPSEKFMSYMSDKKRKGVVDDRSFNYMNDYGTNALNTESGRYGKSNMPLLACNSVTKKQKINASAIKQEEIMQQIDEANSMKKKVKRKADSTVVPSVIPDTMIAEKEAVNVEPEPKPQKKPFTLITPTKHTGFSFSIIHLLTAIRKAMIIPRVESDMQVDVKPKTAEEDKKVQIVNPSASEPTKQNSLPSLTVQEIVDRVRTNPGDPCILETQEPLQDLVRGVLKLFSSKTAPLGAKAWKALVLYEKSNKSWSWMGPVSLSMHDINDNNDNNEEETSPEAWGLPYKTLVKLVDSFANWLKCGQETLKQIGSLPPPPTTFLPQLDEKERFRDLRAQKSLNTIKPSSAEVRKYFRSEELLRYTIPDRAFSYTTADGKKSIVAPLRRGGGKPTSKARDHPILKPDRPPHVTILCLVRDAAARLPGSIGTRADVCTLIRDSQYVVEDVTDERVNQVVSGALDRLHYERDPCVQFDSDRKLWVYLHKDREEEDFEDDGTSSTKKWKRPRKDASEQAEQTETVVAGNDMSLPTTADQAMGGYDLNSDINANISSVKAETENLLVYNDMRPNMEENIHPYVDPSSAGDSVQGNAMSWEPMGLNPLHENTVLSQENSMIEDYNNETFSRERPAEFLNANFL